MTPNLASKEEVSDILDPYKDDLAACFEYGFKCWQELLASNTELAVILTPRSRASIIYDHIAFKALERFRSRPNVSITESRGFLSVTLCDKVILRFKKYRGKNSLYTSRNSTNQTNDYYQQALPGLENITHVIAGYLLDDLGTQLVRSAITCWWGSERLWTLDLDISTAQVEQVASDESGYEGLFGPEEEIGEASDEG